MTETTDAMAAFLAQKSDPPPPVMPGRMAKANATLRCARLYVDPLGNSPGRGQPGILTIPAVKSMRKVVNKARAERVLAPAHARAELQVLDHLQIQLEAIEKLQGTGPVEVAVVMGDPYPLVSPGKDRKAERRRTKQSRKQNRPKKKKKPRR